MSSAVGASILLRVLADAQRTNSTRADDDDVVKTVCSTLTGNCALKHVRPCSGLMLFMCPGICYPPDGTKEFVFMFCGAWQDMRAWASTVNALLATTFCGWEDSSWRPRWSLIGGAGMTSWVSGLIRPRKQYFSWMGSKDSRGPTADHRRWPGDLIGYLEIADGFGRSSSPSWPSWSPVGWVTKDHVTCLGY